MTIAHRLAQRGECVTLFEGADHWGGLAGAWKLGHVVWDRHYHVTLLSDTSARALLTELDLEREMQWVETKTGFYTDGKLYSLSNSLEFLRFPPLGLVDKFRLGATIFHASRLKDWKSLEQIPVSDWLRRWSGARTFEKIWLPLLRAKLGANYRETSAAFIWATIARMYAARRTGLKKEMFGYVPGGYARILDRFAALLAGKGVALRTNHRAERVESLPDGAVELSFQGGARERFDGVVLTVPAPTVSRLCPGLSSAEHAQHRRIKYQGILCASLLLERPLAPYYVTNITDSGVPFTAVIEMSALVDRREFDGNSLVYLPKYVPSDDPGFERSDDELREEFVAALERMYPHFRRSDVLAFRLSRVRQVVALSTLNYSANLPPMATSLPGVFAVNSAQIVNGTLNVNETVRLANEAVATVLTHTQPLTQQPASQDPAHVEADRELVAGPR